MNHMNEVAELLGVEIGEEFNIRDKNTNEISCRKCKLTENNLMLHCDDGGWGTYDEVFGRLFNGQYEIVKNSWKPKNGERYYRIGVNMHDERTVWHCVWENDIMDIMRYKLGNCFKTEEEATSNIDAYLKWVHSSPLTHWREL